MALDSQFIAEFNELYMDAQVYADRISPWEQDFIQSIAGRIGEWGERTLLSDKQKEVIDRIKNKVYAI